MATDTTIDLTLGAGTITTGLHVERLTGREALSEPYEHRVVFRSNTAIAVDKVLGLRASATVRLKAGTLGITGLVMEFTARDPLGDQGFLYEIAIAPQLRLLELTKQNQVYGTDDPISVKDLIKKALDGKLGDNHAAPSISYKDETSTKGETSFKAEQAAKAKANAQQDPNAKTASAEYYANWNFIVQYDESDLTFLSRWCERYGIFYFFQIIDGAEIVIFGDSNTAFPEAANKLPYRNGATTQSATSEAVVTSFGFVARPVPKSIKLKDYDYNTPNLPIALTADIAGGFSGTVVEFGRNYVDAADNAILIKRRAEEIACRGRIFHGTSNAPTMRPGVTFTLEGHPSLNDAYLVTQVEHDIATPSPDGYGAADPTSGAPYLNRFEAIPLAVPFRPQRSAPWPTASGLFSAKIETTTDTPLADLDQQGRYKVKVIYDEATHAQGKGSDFVRKAEPYAGSNDTGMHFPLHDGTEVLLACLNGDLDRPVIVGAVPNPLTHSVVAKDNANMNRIRWTSGAMIEVYEKAMKN